VHACAPGTRDRSFVVNPSLVEPALLPEPLPFDEPRVLCAGRLVADKGFDVALAAWALLRDRFPRARLVLAGDGPERARLTQQATALGILESVDFLGWVPPETLPALLNSTTIVLVPSRWREAFGLIALQAAQMGRPVVATRVGGLPEVVIDGETGMLIARDDSEALAGALALLLQHSDMAVRMGRDGRRRAQEVFRWERCIQTHDQLYRQLGEEVAHASAC
jgi:glycogen(starch) synthase